MGWRQAVVLCISLGVLHAEDLTFPPGFMFGAATSSYQVEGGWNASDKTESIWDRHTHEHPTKIADRSNGDIACDSYHLWKRDIEMAEELGLDFYRFSLSWPRILPTGFPNYISEDGKNYYNNLIDGLLERGIEPMVTIYHWELPQTIQDLGGWTNPLIADWFADYARVAYSLFGDRVQMWLTINEPMIMCDAVYNTGAFAPLIVSPDIGTFLCNKNSLVAHAKAWRVYDEEFRCEHNGKVSLANQLVWLEASSPEDEEIAELAREYGTGRYTHPIFSEEGGWPPSIEQHMKERSRSKGYSRPMLPPFTQEEIELVRGTYDYFAMNFYTSRLVRQAEQGEQFLPWPAGDIEDLNVILEKPDEWPASDGSAWIRIYPEGIRKQLVWLKQEYGDIEIVITENGVPMEEELEDQGRLDYYRDHLKQVLLAIKEDGVRVTGYTAWSLMDNFEWSDGYRTKFGLYKVDFSDPLRTRTPRDSALYYADVIYSRSLDVPE